MKIQIGLFLIFSILLTFSSTHLVFAASQTVVVDAGETETLSFYLKEGDKIRFQMRVDGGSNDDINVKIKNPIGGLVAGGGVVESYGDTITADTSGNYIFEFDNGISIISSKRVDFTYEIIKRPIPQAIASTASEAAGGCLIATATYGSELAPQVQMLREIRDTKLMTTASGASFMTGFNQLYYSFSPIISDLERENPFFKETVKIAITPMIKSLSILQYVDMNSEAQVLGYGLSLIILNVGMYIGIPVVAIIGIRKVRV